ncbi:MAG: DNA polymerase III subunit chi [Pseudomonadota bacterium]|nr:MAG: DNA polymerase III subunit chi [Pseudomonadota bacterium]
MTRVDFYVLDSGGAAARNTLACRLVEKAWLRGHQIYMHAPSPADAKQLDDLLWTFRAGSFVPHRLQENANETPCPVHIGTGEAKVSATDVLINLAADVPPFFSRFERVIEVVAPDAPVRDAARERYRYYRDRGYALESHNISGKS